MNSLIERRKENAHFHQHFTKLHSNSSPPASVQSCLLAICRSLLQPQSNACSQQGPAPVRSIILDSVFSSCICVSVCGFKFGRVDVITFDKMAEYLYSIMMKRHLGLLV